MDVTTGELVRSALDVAAKEADYELSWSAVRRLSFDAKLDVVKGEATADLRENAFVVCFFGGKPDQRPEALFGEHG